MRPWSKPLTVQFGDKTQRQAETVSSHSTSKAKRDRVPPLRAPRMEAPGAPHPGAWPGAGLSKHRQSRHARVVFHFLAATLKIGKKEQVKIKLTIFC